MSFIAITYGYNQYSIFNTNTSTQPLIDNIITICMDEILSLLQLRLNSLNKEIEIFNQDEDQLKSSIRKLESDKKNLEDRLAEAIKAAEAALKETTTKTGKNTKINSKSKINTQTHTDLQVPLNTTIEEIKQTDIKLQTTQENKDKTLMKRKLLIENLERYKNFDRVALLIDLVDGNGEKININSKGDLYANQYLNDRQCYEIHRLITSKIN